MKTLKLDLKLKKLNFIIASHIFATGPALDLEEYLYPKIQNLLFIGHPFIFAKQKNSFYRFYKNNKLQKEYQAFAFKIPQLFLNIKDAFYTLWWVLQKKEKFDFYIGSDSMMAFLGFLLKLSGKVDRVVLYTIDYMPKRFNNVLLNWLYHFFDKMCLKFCHMVWNVSPNMAKAREKYNGIKIEDNAPQIVVPLGVWYQRIPKLPIGKKDKFTIVFMGHLIAKQGVDLVIQAMPEIIKKIPQTKLLIIGTGVYENYLKKITHRLKMEKYVQFIGFIDSHAEVEKLLAQSTVAVAMYKPDPLSFTNWSDPGKLKNYLAAGLPIFLTSVPHISKEIENKRCGFIISYDAKKLSQAIISLLLDRKKLDEYSQNTTSFAKQFDWNKVFSKALRSSI